MPGDRTILTSEQLEKLHEFIDTHIHRSGCDHTRRFIFRWADEHGIDKNDLEDALDRRGGFCDCEVVMNVEPEVELTLPPPDSGADGENPWLISPKFEPEKGKVYTKAITGWNDPEERSYVSDDELLIPAPRGCRPRQRMRRFRHFFVGHTSGQPTDIGIITELRTPVSALEFAEIVRSSNWPELTAFGEREAAYYLNRADRLKVDEYVCVEFREVTGIAGKRTELNIHKVVVR